MIALLTEQQIGAFQIACSHEHVFGSKALAALRAYGLDHPDARFYVCRENGMATAALYLANGVLVISANDNCDPAPIAELARKERVREIDTNFTQCEALQGFLGGKTESSFFMMYRGTMPDGDFYNISPGDLRASFDVLQRSHAYYRSHFVFETWAADLNTKLDKGLMELYQLEMDGRVIGTGSVISEDDECGVIAAVAVIPEYRHRGFGAHISRFLTKRILNKGKTPRLISGYDEVAELYKQVGFETCGRWGELCL